VGSSKRTIFFGIPSSICLKTNPMCLVCMTSELVHRRTFTLANNDRAVDADGVELAELARFRT